jgi:hypothetical protein
MAVVAPSLAGASLAIGAYVAAGLFATGLRTVARSAAVRRMPGGSDVAHVACRRPCHSRRSLVGVSRPAGRHPHQVGRGPNLLGAVIVLQIMLAR